MRTIILTAIAGSLLFTAPAQAAHHRQIKHRHHHSVPNNLANGMPWCGAWMALHEYGRNIRRLWVARAWAHEGRPASGPRPGVIGVKPHHVFKVIQVVGPGKVLAISGNDNGAVRTRVRSTKGVIAWREI